AYVDPDLRVVRGLVAREAEIPMNPDQGASIRRGSATRSLLILAISGATARKYSAASGHAFRSAPCWQQTTRGRCERSAPAGRRRCPGRSSSPRRILPFAAVHTGLTIQTD